MLKNLLKRLTIFFSAAKVSTSFEYEQESGQKQAKYATHIYTLESQEEAEKRIGEKLYKISDNEYVNQKKRNFIESEHHPVIALDFSETFITLQFSLSEVYALDWHPEAPELFCIVKVSDTNFKCLCLTLKNNLLKIKNEQIIEIPTSYQKILNLSHHPVFPRLLITLDNQLCIWDYEAQNVITSTLISGYDLRSGGFYPDDTKAWVLSMEKDYGGGYDWAVWDYRTDNVDIVELERHDHYGRGATIHPSGKLIGALWNAYKCGYFLHKTTTRENQPHYYAKPAPERSEYEAYSPCFSPDGKHFAFVVNPHLGWRKNYSRVCIYNIEDASLNLEFYTGLSITEQQMQFVHSGKNLAFYEYETSRLHIYDANNGKKKATLKVPGIVKYFSGHRLYGYYAVIDSNGVTIFVSDTAEHIAENPNYRETAQKVTEHFIKANAKYLIPVGQYID